MQIVNVHPGILPIPPKNWGAVEKIIWNYTLQLNSLGVDASFKYLDDINPIEYDVVHCHVTNLANIAHQRGMEYFFSLHDHHVLFDYPNEDYIVETRNAIKNSIKTFVHTEEFFHHKHFSDLSEKFIYLRHGVDKHIYANKAKPRKDLLCVASNGLIGFPLFDRKGFLLATQVAQHLNMNLTICCPSNTKDFLNACNIPSNDHVNILYDLSEEELIDQYNSHKIFLHPSVLEAGHPNLTLVEALSSGIPVVGTYKGSMDLAGMCVVNDLTPVSYVNAVRHILNNYNEYSTSTQNNQVFEWNYVVKDLLGFYKKYGYTLEKFKSVLYNSYIDKNGSHHGYQLPINKIHTSFDDNNNIKLEIIGPEDATYNVKFIGVLHDGQEVIQYQSEIRNNMWCSAQNNNFLQWNVVIDNTLHNIYKIIHT
jgi:glycosyltransferase involved in cell wall biosynthesis